MQSQQTLNQRKSQKCECCLLRCDGLDRQLGGFTTVCNTPRLQGADVNRLSSTPQYGVSSALTHSSSCQSACRDVRLLLHLASSVSWSLRRTTCSESADGEFLEAMYSGLAAFRACTAEARSLQSHTVTSCRVYERERCQAIKHSIHTSNTHPYSSLVLHFVLLLVQPVTRTA